MGPLATGVAVTVVTGAALAKNVKYMFDTVRETAEHSRPRRAATRDFLVHMVVGEKVSRLLDKHFVHKKVEPLPPLDFRIFDNGKHYAGEDATSIIQRLRLERMVNAAAV